MSIKAYTKGDILEVPIGGWDIEILDPDGDHVCYLHYGHEGMRWSEYAEKQLHEMADGLLSHLNRE